MIRHIWVSAIIYFKSSLQYFMLLCKSLLWIFLALLCLYGSARAAPVSDLPGWPQATGDYIGYIFSSPVMGDLDGDGYLDVVISSIDQKVHVWDRNGKPLPGWPRPSFYAASSPALGDLDEDGYLDVVVGSRDGKVHAWDRKGDPLPGWPKLTTKYHFVDSSPALADLDADGHLDVVVGCTDRNIYAWDRKGNLLPGWPQATASYIYYSSPALADLDGDGYLDVVVGSGDKKVYAWDRKGNPLPGWPITTGNIINSSPALGDLDGDGYLDVVVGSRDYKIYAWDRKGNILPGWPKTVGDDIYSSPALGDLDGDGYLDVVVGSDDTKVYAWDRNGNLLPGWPKATGHFVWSSPTLGDLDGDGYMDVVAGSWDNKVYAWNRYGDLLPGWPMATGDDVVAAQALGDLNDDGYLDVVAGSRDGKIYAWSSGARYDANSIQWGMFRHDPMHSGLQPDDDLTGPVISNFSPTTTGIGGSFHIFCQITDRSGVYDDDSGPDGQGVYLIWDSDGDITGGNITKMSRASGDTFQTDVEIPGQPTGELWKSSIKFAQAFPKLEVDFVYQVTAYDDDFDGGDPRDRAMRNSEIQRITFILAPVVSSPTHPDPSVWYNLNRVQFEWTTYYTTSGYYIAFDQQRDTIPTERIGEYTLDTSIIYPVVADGTWYFHVASEHKPGEEETATGHYQVNIDTEPPEVSSITHPDQTIWYQNRNPEFNWDTAHPSSAPWFYYIIDTNPDTVPTINSVKASAMNLTLNEIDDGVWYFHIVWEDMAGNVGNKATHYKISIDDTDPPPVTQLEAHIQANKDITLRWSDPGDKASGIAYYHIFRSEQPDTYGRKISGDVTETTYTDAGVWAPGRILYYAVFPTDNAGNKQTQGNVQVQALYPDLIAPKIISLSPAELFTAQFTRLINRQLSITVAEEKGIGENALMLHIQFDGSTTGIEKTIPMTRTGDGSPYNFTAEIPFSEASDGQKVKFWVTGADLAGNEITSDTKPSLLVGDAATVTIDNSNPKITNTYPQEGDIIKQDNTLPAAIDITSDEAGSGVDSSNSIFTITRSDVDVKSQTVNGNLSVSAPGHLVFIPVSGFQDGLYEVFFQIKDMAGNAGERVKLTFTIDQTSPVIVGFDADSPKSGDFVPAGNHNIKISVKEQVRIESGNLELNYEVYTDTPTGVPVGTFGMNKSDDKPPYVFSATLPLANVSEGRKVDYWITGTDSAGNPLTSILKPSLLAGEKATITIMLRGDINKDGKVRSDDAILVLRISAKLAEPTEYQKLVADMNGDGAIRANDAILILRKSAGLAAPGTDVAASKACEKVTIMLAEAQGIAGESITVPLRADNANGLAGGDICIAYEPSVLRPVEVMSSPEIAAASNLSEPGLVRIAFASTEGLRSETLAEVKFDILADNISPLKLQQVELYQFDTTPVKPVLIDGKFMSPAMKPEYSILLQNFPNPFNPETWIPYHLSEDSHVVIRIYSAAGKLVKTIDLGFKRAGYYDEKEHSAYWDGKNEYGEQVSSGVYFYQISAGSSFYAMRKMAIVR